MNILKFLFASIACLLFGCKDSTISSVVRDSSMDILLVNQSGVNLIEQNEIDENNVKVYFLIKDKKELYYNGLLDHPRGYTIAKDSENRKVFRLFANDDQKNPITLIEYPNNDIDTIKCEFYISGATKICSQVWYNNALMWKINEDQYAKTRSFTIVKNI